MNDLPEIRIKDGWLIRQEVSVHLHKLWGREGEPLVDDEWMERRVKEYQDAWKPFESKILLGMTQTMELSFKQNMIDIYIAPWFHAFSDPLIVGVIYVPDLFIDILPHEPARASRKSGWLRGGGQHEQVRAVQYAKQLKMKRME